MDIVEVVARRLAESNRRDGVVKACSTVVEVVCRPRRRAKLIFFVADGERRLRRKYAVGSQKTSTVCGIKMIRDRANSLAIAIF
jgi:hypothetical protein